MHHWLELFCNEIMGYYRPHSQLTVSYGSEKYILGFTATLNFDMESFLPLHDSTVNMLLFSVKYWQYKTHQIKCSCITFVCY